jgi:uncharacterized protein YndB with AHSA1/START domain
MRLKVRTAAPLPAVHHALTDPVSLRTWLADRAEVDPPARYEFWGRSTPAGDRPRQRLLHVDDHTLRFAWTVEEVETIVEIVLAGTVADGTTLTLSQTGLPPWSVMVAERSVLSVLHTFWALSIANLVDFVEGRPLTPQADFTSPRMQEQIRIGATPAEVFRSIVDPDLFARWFGAKVEVEPRVGGRWSMGGFEQDATPARILELEPDRRFVIEFGDGVVTTWDLTGDQADAAGGTTLTFMQSGFDETSPPYGAWMGWLGGLAELRRFHELPDWRPTWLDVQLQGVPEGLLTIADEEV